MTFSTARRDFYKELSLKIVLLLHAALLCLMTIPHRCYYRTGHILRSTSHYLQNKHIAPMILLQSSNPSVSVNFTFSGLGAIDLTTSLNGRLMKQAKDVEENKRPTTIKIIFIWTPFDNFCQWEHQKKRLDSHFIITVCQRVDRINPVTWIGLMANEDHGQSTTTPI